MKEQQKLSGKKNVTESKHANSEEKCIVAGLKRFGRKAYFDALVHVGEATVLRGNRVCRVNKRGDVVVIEELEQTKYRVPQQSYKLK